MRRPLAHLGISFVSVCATLLFLEVGIRIVHPQDLEYWDSRSFRRIKSTSPHFVENIPNTSANFLGVPVRINRLGLREDEIATPKPLHTLRVVVVGDSVTFGYGIPVENTYAKLLEKRLNEQSSDGMRYEVLNGGTLGGSLADYLHFLTMKAELLQPDIVIVGLNLNDVFVYSESGNISEDGAEWQGARQPRLHRFSEFLLRHSHLYMFCYTRLKLSLYALGVLDMNKLQGSNFAALAPPSAYQAEAWESTLGMLSRIAAFCWEHGYRLVVVVFPMQMQMSPAELKFYREKYRLQLGDGALTGEPQRRLREFAAATCMSLLDLLPVYRTYNSQDLYLRNNMIRSDPNHPSVKGNQVAADEIFRVLRNFIRD